MGGAVCPLRKNPTPLSALRLGRRKTIDRYKTALCTGELDAGEDQEPDSADDGDCVRAVDAPGHGDAPPAGDQRERGAARALPRQHAARTAAVGRRRTGIPPTDEDRPATTAGTPPCQTGHLRVSRDHQLASLHVFTSLFHLLLYIDKDSTVDTSKSPFIHLFAHKSIQNTQMRQDK